jgi:serine/threonine protein kinase
MILAATTDTPTDLRSIVDWSSLLVGASGGNFGYLCDFDLLDETAHSVVLACRNRDSGEDLVLKLAELPPGRTTLDSKAAPNRVALIRKLNEPCLVRVLAEGVMELRRGAIGYSLMERVMGGTLRGLVHEHAHEITVGGLLAMLRGVASAIDGLHRCGVLHRDVKPENIFADRDAGIAKLGDLGIACYQDLIEEEQHDEAWGTPEYMAPEQIVSNRYGPPVDIYALAVTIYYALTRHHPFDADLPRDILYAKIHGNPVPITRRNRNWPASLHRVLARSLSRDPSERHETATELVREVAGELETYTPYRLSTYLDGRFSSGEVSIDISQLSFPVLE